MAFTRKNKIRDAWENPIGHDMILRLLVRAGKREKWIEKRRVANAPIEKLEKLGGAAFVDRLLYMMTLCGESTPTVSPAQESAWWRDSVAYKIYLPGFLDSDQDGYGDIRGVIQKLPYIEKLGVKIVWLVPFLADIGCPLSDYKNPLPDLGTVADFEELVDAAHKRDMRVVFDLDSAATSDRHPWFLDALAGGPCRDYYVMQSGDEKNRPEGWEAGGALRGWKYYAGAGVWALTVGDDERMALNGQCPAMRDAFNEMTEYWYKKGVDGFCFWMANMLGGKDEEDASHLNNLLLNICGYEKNGYEPNVRSYVAVAREKSRVYGEKLFIGQANGLGTGMAAELAGEGSGGFDVIMDESHLQPLLCPEDPVSMYALKRHFLTWQGNFAGNNWMLLFFESSRFPRIISRVGAPQLYRTLLAKLFAIWLLTMRGLPVVYQGQELGLPNAPGNKNGGMPAARSAMPWSMGPAYGFTSAAAWEKASPFSEYLNVDVQMADNNSVLNFYIALIRLRNGAPALRQGSFDPVFVESKKVMCYFRRFGTEKWYVEMNLTEREVPRPGRILQGHRLVMSNYGQAAAYLRPFEANLYKCE